MKTDAAFLITSLDFGGAEAQLTRVAIRLAQAGWNISVSSLLPPVAYAEQLREAGIPVHSLGMTRGVPSPAALTGFIRLLQRQRPAVLVTFMYHANLLGRLAGRFTGVPVVSSIRNENFGGPSRDRLLRFTDPLAKATTINSRLAAQAVLARRVVPAHKLHVIPNGLDVSLYRAGSETRARLRNELGLPEEVFVWLAAGRLEKQKDYPTLLHAFASLPREPAAALLIAGHGSLAGELASLAGKLGLADRVTFLGARTDMPELLAASDALVLSSAWEGLPNVVMEALAAGKPVVATRVGGVAELVTEGETGFLVTAGAASSLADALASLMLLPAARRQELGDAGRKRITEEYGIESVVNRWQALLTGIQAVRPVTA